MASRAGTLGTIGTALMTTAAAGAALYYLYSKNLKRQINERIVNELMLLFDIEECHLKDQAILRSKLRKLVEGGAQRLQVVTDFDRTLTRAFVDGKDGHQSYGVVEDSPYIGEEANRTLNGLREKYLPIEMSSSIPEHEKIPHMIEWWSSAMNIAATVNLQKRLIPIMVQEGRSVLRDGCGRFLRLCKLNDIPLLVLSAGIGDVVNEVLRQQAEIPPQLKVIANFYSFDENNVVDGMKGELIHTFNKNEVSIKNQDYFDAVKCRRNIILMGDTLGDPGMADGIQNVDAIIKIGFLNKHAEVALETYLSCYDIVLTNDASMDIINVLLQKVIQQ